MATFAERALESAPKRITESHVAALMEADVAARKLRAEEAVRELKRQRRIEAAQAARAAAAKGERAAEAMRKVAGR